MSSVHGPDAGRRYVFGEVVVDAAAHTLSVSGEPVSVEPKAYAVLLQLLQHAGALVGKDELLDAVWGHRHVTPGVLTRAIAQLRAAIGDDPHDPRYIQTRHGVGYRFVGVLEAPVAELPDERAMRPPVVADAAAFDADAAHSVHAAAAVDGQADGEAAAWSTRLLWLVLPMALIAAALWWRQQTTVPEVRDASIAVLPFRSLSDASADRHFAEGLAVELHGALAVVPGLTIASWVPRGALAAGDTPQAIGRRHGVATVLDATVRRVGDRIRIDARLSDTANGHTLWSRRYDRVVSDVFATQHEIASEVVHALLGVMPDVERSLRARLAPTHNVASYDAYLRGMRQLAAGGGGEEDTIALFRTALRGDADFARAQAGLCRAELRRFTNFRNADALASAKDACLRAERMDPESGDVGLALANLYRVQGDHERALQRYRTLLGDRAFRVEAHLGIGNVRAAQGQQAAAFSEFERALALEPRNVDVLEEIGFLHYLAGRVPEAIAWYRRAGEIQPGNGGLWGTLGGLNLVAGRNADAARALERSIAIEPSEVTLSNLAKLRYQACDYAGAASLYRRATELNPGDFIIWGNLSEALYADPATEREARAAFFEAATRGQRYVELKPRDAKALASLGRYRAGLGEVAAARSLALRAEEIDEARGDVALLNAETFAVLGDFKAARARIERAQAEGIAETLIATNAVFHRAGIPVAASPGGADGATAPCKPGPTTGG